MGAMLSGALAAVSLAVRQGLDFRSKAEATDRKKPVPQGHSYRITAKRTFPNAISAQKVDLDRIIVDRSSSVRKLQRWARAGRVNLPESDRAANRHKVRRIENQRAINLAKLSSP